MSCTIRHAILMAVEAVVLPKVSTDVPSTSVPFSDRWKYLLNLQLAYPYYGTPRNINLILGANVFSCAVHHSGRFGPQKPPSIFKTALNGSWLLPLMNALTTATSLSYASD